MVHKRAAPKGAALLAFKAFLKEKPGSFRSTRAVEASSALVRRSALQRTGVVPQASCFPTNRSWGVIPQAPPLSALNGSVG